MFVRPLDGAAEAREGCNVEPGGPPSLFFIVNESVPHAGLAATARAKVSATFARVICTRSDAYDSHAAVARDGCCHQPNKAPLHKLELSLPGAPSSMACDGVRSHGEGRVGSK